ncbi:hypothetical protein HQ587_05520 [bacterium]|nr:hypothetical protein [bacterium]
MRFSFKHVSIMRSFIPTLLVLTFCFCLAPNAECQEENFKVWDDEFWKGAPREDAIIDSIGACCHYLAEIPYIRITFQFPRGAREFDITTSDDIVPSERLKDYQTYEFHFTDIDTAELFHNIKINYTNTFFVLEFVSYQHKNYLLLSKNIKITDKQIKQFVKTKIFMDIFIIIDLFDIMDVMEVIEYHIARQDTVFIEKVIRDTVYQDTFYIEKVVYDTIYLKPDIDREMLAQKGLIDTVFIDKTVHDTIYVAKLQRDTVFIDKETEIRIFIEEDVLDTIPVVEKVVFANNGDFDTNLNYVLNSKFSSWFGDPYFILEFKFKGKFEDLTIEKPKHVPDDIPEGYEIQYVIYAEDSKSGVIFPELRYVKIHRKIALKLGDNRCSLLTRKGMTLEPQDFQNRNGKSSSILINY